MVMQAKSIALWGERLLAVLPRSLSKKLMNVSLFVVYRAADVLAECRPDTVNAFGQLAWPSR